MSVEKISRVSVPLELSSEQLLMYVVNKVILSASSSLVISFEDFVSSISIF